MNVIINTFVLFFCFRVGAIELLKRSSDFVVENESMWNPIDKIINNDGFGNEMNSTVRTSVNHYYCSVEEIEDPVIILYGTKSWTFQTQDVNLTLSYPTTNVSEREFSSEEEGYLITGFKVVLYVDGLDTKGFIMDGGVLQESIVLSFVSRNITSLSYQFWLYGISKYMPGYHFELNTRYNLCK